VAIRFKKVSGTEITIKASTVSEARSVLRRLGIETMATGDVQTLSRLARPISATAPSIRTKPVPRAPAKRAPKIPTTRVKKAAAKRTAKKSAAKRTARKR
jgi:hypothetical protein